MTPHQQPTPMSLDSAPAARPPHGFSLIEVLAAVGIIGIIAFLAIPNIVSIKADSERNLAISKAEGINMAIVSYIQANGRENVASTWNNKTPQVRYSYIRPYLSFAPNELTDYTPKGYEIIPPANLNALEKSVLREGSTKINY